MKHVGLRSNAKDIASQEQLGDLAIIYPNGGSSSSPANISVSTRYVETNPFPGFLVICLAEVRLSGKWGAAGWFFSSDATSGGTIANQYDDSSIVVQTAVGGVTHSGAVSGSPHGAIGPISSAPCRVKVWKVKGAA